MGIDLPSEHVHKHVHECEPAAHPEENRQIRLRFRLLVNHVLIRVELNLHPDFGLRHLEIIKLGRPMRLILKHGPILETACRLVKHSLDVELIGYVLVALH